MAKRKQEGICPICGREVDVIVSAYRDHPFIDGRCYSEICWVCANVPRTCEILPVYDDGFCVHENYLMVYNTFDAKRLFSVKELMEDGFTRDEAERSIKAIKQAVKHKKPHDGEIPIRHCINLPPGCGKIPEKTPEKQIHKFEREDDMSRKHKKNTRLKQQQQQQQRKEEDGRPVLKKQQQQQQQQRKEKDGRPVLVQKVTIREITEFTDR